MRCRFVLSYVLSRLTIRTSAERNQERSPLLRLPPELQIIIFELAFDTAVIRASPLSTSGDWSDFHRVLRGFIISCRLIHHDSKPLLRKHGIFGVSSSRCFNRTPKFENLHVRKLEIYNDATQQIMWKGQRHSFFEVWYLYLFRESFPALETIECPSYWKDYRSGEKTCEDAVRFWFRKPDLQVTYHCDPDSELDLKD